MEHWYRMALVCSVLKQDFGPQPEIEVSHGSESAKF